jgi:hypothetical protein
MFTTSTETYPSLDSASTPPPSLTPLPPASQNTGLLPGAPISPLFEIRQTPTAGRAVFATRDIPADTLIWRSDDLILNVLLREYRREVCGQCFEYDRGRDLEIRDKDVGFAFCSVECRDKWRNEVGEIGVQAWSAVEELVRKRSKEDNEMVDIDLPRPSVKDTRKAWDSVAVQADLIRTARGGEEGTEVTKQHRKALSKALQAQLSPDVLSFCLSGLLWYHTHPESWPALLALANDETPYSSADDLAAFTRTYLHLLSILPAPLLPHLTPSLLQTLSSRDSHNSFGIRSLEDEGSEFFGYGCWPAASYFNHSCVPNVEKKRAGRVWEFRAARKIGRGNDVCITYLSGEERGLSRGKRWEILRRNWGFECGCERCQV